MYQMVHANWYVAEVAQRQNTEPANEPPSEAKVRLLAATIDYVADNGITDRSLREIAAAIGTSHRMLLYHFGSKEGLLVEVVRAVEAEQRRALSALSDDAPLDALEQTSRLAKRLTNPRLRRNERLFFELYAQALQGRGPAADLLPELVHVWLPPLRDLSIRLGVPEHEADAHARLMLAVARGLLLDLVGTGERRAVDQAMELFNRMTVAAHL
jgi:AcrR family transcriptional regulator